MFPVENRRSTRKRGRLLLGALAGTALTCGTALATGAAAEAATITARYDNGVLTVTGNAQANRIVISRTPAGRILVNRGNVQIQGGRPTVRNTRWISVGGRAGNDVIRFNEANGRLPQGRLSGGPGHDMLTGGSGPDRISGQGGNDTIFGMAGADTLLGRAGNDTLTGGDGDDRAFGQGGDDRMIWNPGDDTDRNEGAVGTDTVEVNGGDGAEVFRAAANGTRVRFDRADPAPFAIDIGTSERLLLNANGGNDRFTATGNLAALIAITANGGDGNDTLLGSNGNDTLTGDDGDDQVVGQGGDDRMIWNPGDDTDLNEGGPGTDTTQVNGGDGAETFATTANGARVRFDRLDPAPFAIDIGTTENLLLNANGGNDSHSGTGNLAALITLTVDGGAGNDTLLGSNGIDLLRGGDGNDFIDGQQGNDVAFLGAGNDTFQWDPGDGSDIIEGQANTDTMLFNGSAGNEIFEVSANGPRVRFTRNLGNIVMDLDDVEVTDLNALGGTDTITVNDLTGTDLTELAGDLAGTIGGTAGDGQADNIIVNGTNGDDVALVTGSGSSVSVAGLPARVNLTNSEGANDRLTVNGLAGDDVIDASGLAAGVIQFVADGGTGDDALIGSDGNDVLSGGPGDDVLLGGPGTDVIDGGDGDDVEVQFGPDQVTSAKAVDQSWLDRHPQLAEIVRNATSD
jgi:Ca2+-binding RTX toxin-like protein